MNSLKVTVSGTDVRVKEVVLVTMALCLLVCSMCLFFKHWKKNYRDINQVKFIYSEKATKFCETFTLLYVVPVKSKVKISQNFLAFSEYMNFKMIPKAFFSLILRWSPYFHILCKAYFIDLNHLWQYGL